MLPFPFKEQSIPKCAINELKGGIAPVINECEQLGPEILKTKKLPYKRPPKHVTIIPTDKTKRLIALDTEQYKDMVDTSTIKTGNYEQSKRLNQPRTEQIRFNGQLNKIADKYKTQQPKLWRDLKSHICSEPLPCPVYCLPKDHKQGNLKGRPIHSATDTPATALSKYLVRSVKPLLNHVKSHLKNTDEFINFLNSIENEIHGFCSLDVTNLYGSIPLEDINQKTPGIFTVAKRFSKRINRTVVCH